MKIIYYSSHPYLNLSDPTGYGTHMREMIYAFQELGHTVIPVILGGTNTESINHKASNIKSTIKSLIKKIIPRIFWNSLKDYKLILSDKKALHKLDTIIAKEKPDLIYERIAYLMSSGYKIAQKYSIKYYTEINAPIVEENLIFEGKSLFTSTAKKRVRDLIERSDYIIVVSTALKNHYQDKYAVKEQKTIITPNAINPKKIEVDAATLEQIRRKHNLKPESLVIGFVGSIFPYHGVDKLIKAFAKLKQDNYLQLLIVGDGLILDNLKSLTKKLDIQEKVIFTGAISPLKIYHYIALMDITVMASSNWYGSPVKIFEYGLMGKAIIAPDNIPVRDVMINNKHGLLITQETEKLTQALSVLIQNKKLRNELGLTFQEKVLKEHTWKKMAEKILNH